MIPYHLILVVLAVVFAGIAAWMAPTLHERLLCVALACVAAALII